MTGKVSPAVTLVAFTPEPQRVVADAARTCYASSTPDNKLIKKVMASGHLSVLEHVSFTFAISGVSRALLAQITRHRIASFSVQSQRYVELSDMQYIMPPDLTEEQRQRFHSQMMQIKEWYTDWCNEIPAEDARLVLPNAAATRMVVTMNARELLHFFSLRCCNRAQWEIRQVAWQMVGLVKEVAPLIFENAGPGCIRGACPEGKMTCGHPYNMKGDK